ncbi:MAG: dihydrodipicolinate synthase family protein [Nocardiopsaceae bacterium]|nr:dihydrodipicolinate synthase family protein [Nocardiopsaceae bacterium]
MPDNVRVITATATPFTESGDLDLTAARRLFRLIAKTTGAAFVAGTTGEFPSLDDSERLDLVRVALEELGPDNVIAHIGAASARRARQLAARAVAAGATKIAAVTPYYLPTTPELVTAHYCQVAEAANGAELYAYLFPERTGLTVTPAELAATAKTAGLKGAKLSGTASHHIDEYMDEAPAGFRAYTGRDADLTRAIRRGAAGGISAVSSAFPEAYARLVAALGDTAPGGTAAGDGEVEAAQEAVDRAYAVGAGVSRIKHALAVRGVAGPVARMPTSTVSAEESGAIAELLSQLAPEQAVAPLCCEWEFT